MASTPRLKRKMLAGAVEENLRVLENRPRGKLVRKPPFPWLLFVALLLVGLAAAAVWLPGTGWGPFAEPPPESLLPTIRPTPEPNLPASLPAPRRLPAAVFPVEVTRVVLDPGHGGSDHGTKTSSGLLEKDLTLDLARRAMRDLGELGFEVHLTREDDRKLSLKERASFANELRADLFVSIHFNWFQDGRRNRGIETFYLGSTEDPEIHRLTSRENRDSGYTLGEVRRLLESLYTDFRQEQSGALAQAIQQELLNTVRKQAPEVRDRGVKPAPFLVLIETEMPAALAEVSSLANEEEARLLVTEEYRQALAQALARGIATYSRQVRRGG
jgi:N-acetylmuramoyl-L-alanine amidase